MHIKKDNKGKEESKSRPAFTIGIDFGTNSVRAVVVDVSNGDEMGTAVFDYPTGNQGVILDPADHNLARQNPLDYIDGLGQSVRGALKSARVGKNVNPNSIIGIGVDTTGSTPLPIDSKCRPLALDKKWKDNPAANAWLWKDHTAAVEAARITEIAKEKRPKYVEKYGGTYSSEWFWSKIWHCLNTSPDVFDAAHSWVEFSDYIPALLVGIANPKEIKRNACAAGHKAMFSDSWGGLPDEEFLSLLDPKLAKLRSNLFDTAYASDTPAGQLTAEWAKKLGLPGRGYRWRWGPLTPTWGLWAPALERVCWSKSSVLPHVIYQS